MLFRVLVPVVNNFERQRRKQLRPVSYTHLDVYKRQAFHCFCDYIEYVRPFESVAKQYIFYTMRRFVTLFFGSYYSCFG